MSLRTWLEIALALAVIVTFEGAFRLNSKKNGEIKSLLSLLAEARLWLPKTEQGEDLNRRILAQTDSRSGSEATL